MAGFISNIQKVERLTKSVQGKAGFGERTTIGDAIAKKMEQSPQMDYLFLIELPDLTVEKTGATFAINGGSDNEGVSPDEINHRVYTVSAPFTTFETKKNTDGSTFMYTAAHSDIGSLTLTVDEMEDGATLDYFLRWQQKIKNNDGTYNPPYNYKRDITLVRLSASKLEASVSTYVNYFPTSIGEASFNQDSNGVLQYQITLTGDTVDHTMINPSQLKGILEEEDGGIIDSITDKLPDFDASRAKGVLEMLAGRFG